jgi:hypothetical protein
VAPRPQCRPKDFQDIRLPTNRYICVRTDGTGPGVLLPRSPRSSGESSGRTSPELGFRPDVCLSPSCNDSDSDSEVQAVEGRASSPDSPILDGRPVDIGGQISPIRAAEEAQVQGVARGEQDHRPPSPLIEQAPLDGLAAFRATVTASGASEEVAQFLASSWRRSTQTQYLSVWRSWSEWCQRRGMVPTEVSVNTLLDYLLHLETVKNLAWSTVGVHRSAVSSMLQPLAVPPVGEHPLIVRFMRALFLRRPPAVRPRWTWDVAAVLACVRDWGLAAALDLRRLTWKSPSCWLSLLHAG